MPPLTGLRGFSMATNPMALIEGAFQGYDAAQTEEERGLKIAQMRVALQEQQRVAAQNARPAQTVTMGSPAVPPGLTAQPGAGEDPEAAAFLPRTQGVPAASGMV